MPIDMDNKVAITMYSRMTLVIMSIDIFMEPNEKVNGCEVLLRWVFMMALESLAICLFEEGLHYCYHHEGELVCSRDHMGNDICIGC